MNGSDKEKLMCEICQKWPNKFTDSDLEYWCRQLDRYDVEDILRVLTEWKASSKYAPKLPEIKSRLAKSARMPDSSAKQRYVSVIAQSLAAANPMLDGRPEAELLLRFHRFWFFKYRKDLLTDRTGKMREETDNDRALIREKHRITLESCARDLWGAGCSQEQAQQLAEWFNAPQPDFDSAVSQIGAEVPELV